MEMKSTVLIEILKEATVRLVDKNSHGATAKGNTPLQVVTNRIMPHINKGSPIIILSPLEGDPTLVNAVRDFRARDFDVTVLSPSSLEFEFDARRLDRTGYEVMKTERDILMTELRGLGAFVMDWEPDMLLSNCACRRKRILR